VKTLYRIDLGTDETLTPDIAVATDVTVGDLFSSINRAAGDAEIIPLQRIRIGRLQT